MKEKPFCNQILPGVITDVVVFDVPGDNFKKCFEQNTDIPPHCLNCRVSQRASLASAVTNVTNEVLVPLCLFS